MDTMALIIFLAYAPSLALLWYFYNKDKYEPEPKKYVILTFAYGAIVSVFIAVFFESIIFMYVHSSILTVALVAALVEEPSKAYVIRVPYNAKQMDGIMDGVVYGVAAGLGFAATENLFYGIGYGAGISVIRALLTPIAHGVWTATIGVALGMKSVKRDVSIAPFFLIAIALHFLWNYSASLAETNNFYLGTTILLILINIGMIAFFVRKGLEEDRNKYGLISRYFR